MFRTLVIYLVALGGLAIASTRADASILTTEASFSQTKLQGLQFELQPSTTTRKSTHVVYAPTRPHLPIDGSLQVPGSTGGGLDGAPSVGSSISTLVSLPSDSKSFELIRHCFWHIDECALWIPQAPGSDLLRPPRIAASIDLIV